METMTPEQMEKLKQMMSSDVMILPSNISPEYGYDFAHGYATALLKVLETFDTIQPDLKVHKRRQNYKTYRSIVNCILQNQVALRENPDAYIRCSNEAEGGFELWHNGGRVDLGSGD